MPKNHNGPVNAHRRDEKASPLIAWRKSADLSNEIINLVQFLEPTPEEIHARTALVGQYRKIIHDNYEGSQLFVFGSFATGLYTPWSDMDFVVLPSQPVEHTKGQIASRLSKIARKCYPFTRDLQILRRARVPILKITDQSGYLIDLGYSGDNNQQRSLNKHAYLRPLVMVMKVFLEAHGWNCGFEGGITGYALILWLSAFLSMQSRNARSLAESLLGFFDYFGSGGKFDYYKTGLCISEPSCTFLKADNGMYYRETPYLLAIRDPPDHSNDVGRVAKSIPKIVLGFRTAFEKLTSLSIDDIRDQGHLFSILRIASANLSMRLPKVSFQTEPKEQGRKGQTLKSTGKLHQPKQYRNGQALKYSGSSQVQHQRKPKPHAKEHNLKRNGNSNRFKSSSDGKPSVQSLRTGDSRVTKKFKKLRT